MHDPLELPVLPDLLHPPLWLAICFPLLLIAMREHIARIPDVVPAPTGSGYAIAGGP